MRSGPTRLAVTLAASGLLVLAGCSGTPSPSPAPPTTPVASATPIVVTPAPATPTAQPLETPAPTVPPPAGAAPCAPADLKASHGFVEGAAGSRLTTIVLVSAMTCSIDAFPALGLRDGNGAIAVGASASGTGRLDVVAGDSYEANVRIANWCADQPVFPLTLEIVLGSESVTVTGGSFPEEGDLPPCNGAIGPILEATGWEAAPE
jgi:hypothetical protein